MPVLQNTVISLQLELEFYDYNIYVPIKLLFIFVTNILLISNIFYVFVTT